VSALVIAASTPSAAPVAALMGVGVAVGITGHLAGSRRLAAAGIAILFVATALLLAGAYLSYRDGGGDPRPACPDPVGC
jgi:hypothetical protein